MKIIWKYSVIIAAVITSISGIIVAIINSHNSIYTDKNINKLPLYNIPVMIDIDGGYFSIGCSEQDSDCMQDEKPRRTINVKSFRISKYEVTFDQYRDFARATGQAVPHHGGFGAGRHPLINVSWKEANNYIAWLNKVRSPDQQFRLPTEAEWEFAARGGTKTIFHWGNRPPECDRNSRYGAQTMHCPGGTAPVGSYHSNPFGLHDMHGNVREWVADCWAPSPPKSISANARNSEEGSCVLRTIKGGSYSLKSILTRVSVRFSESPGKQIEDVGFRIAQSLH